MSFLDDIVDAGSGLLGSAWSALSGSGVAAGIAKAAALGFLLKQVTDSVNKENSTPSASDTNRPDTGVREQVNPNVNESIPIVYGTAYTGGIITDAEIANSNQTMFYVLTICEKTGTLIDGTQSQLTFEDIYWDGNRITFQSDGITVASLTDEDGVVNTDVAGLIKFYCFSGNSDDPVVPTGYTNTSLQAAYDIMPNWTASHQMNDLIFAVVRIDYNKDKGTTGLGDVKFKIKNTMTEPGDVLWDYMRNTRYGAGITDEEIYSV